MKRLLLFLGLSLTLAACSLAPISIDLLPYLGGEASGSQSVVAPQEQALDLKLPNDQGYTASGYQTISVRPASVRLDYALRLAQENGQLSGNAQLTFYMAGSSANLWDDGNRLGDPVTLDLDQSALDLSGSLSLSAEQIDALMSGTVTVGAHITGNASGTADVSYRFDRLVLKVAFF